MSPRADGVPPLLRSDHVPPSLRTDGAAIVSAAGRRALSDLMAGPGFEPGKAEPMGLQPIPFDRSGIPPGGGECSVRGVVRPLNTKGVEHPARARIQGTSCRPA